MKLLLNLFPLVVGAVVVYLILNYFNRVEKDAKRDERLAMGPNVKYGFKAALYCLPGFICVVFAAAVTYNAGEPIFGQFAPVAPYANILGMVLWFCGCYAIVNGKGYKWFWALLGFFPLFGLAVLLLGFKNKRGPQDLQQSKTGHLLWTCIVIVILSLLFIAWSLFVIPSTSRRAISPEKNGVSRHQDSINKSVPSWNYLRKGDNYILANRFEEAIEPLKEAIRLQHDKTAESYLSLGLAYLRLSRFEEAVEAQKQAIRLQPEGTPAYYGLGVAYVHLNRHQEAIEPLKHAIRINPANANTYRYLGRAYLMVGDKSEALKAYKTLKALDPKEAEMLFDEINQE